MNTFIATNIYYLRACRTIEIVLVSNNHTNKKFYVYNYEGYSFRVFKTVTSLNLFFSHDKDCDFHFESDESLDNFFSNVLID